MNIKIIDLLKGVFTSILAILATGFWSIPIALSGVLKLILPFNVITRYLSAFADMMMWGWCYSLMIILKITNHIEWDIKGLENLNKKSWYLLICNHKSWTDIVILCNVLRNTIPMNKFFLKQNLIWVPFVGLACWALDMPFMKRYSHAYLVKHPEKRGKDIETTKKSCQKFKLRPTTVVNFVEGSRFTDEKHHAAKSPYKNLLPAKAAGIAFALSVLGEQFNKVLNVTIVYPNNQQTPFTDLLCGRLSKVVIRLETIEVTDEIRGDYLNDKIYKRQFQQWLNHLWQKKDQQIEKIKLKK